MLVNPRIEIYLLDSAGGILAYSAPAARVVRDRVGLAPVRRFLAGDAVGPIAGDDPRSGTRRKVFSAAAIPGTAEPAGYLYVVLQSEQYAGVAQMLASSYVLRIAALAAGLSALATLGAGLLVFRADAPPPGTSGDRRPDSGRYAPARGARAGGRFERRLEDAHETVVIGGGGGPGGSGERRGARPGARRRGVRRDQQGDG